MGRRVVIAVISVIIIFWINVRVPIDCMADRQAQAERHLLHHHAALLGIELLPDRPHTYTVIL